MAFMDVVANTPARLFIEPWDVGGDTPPKHRIYRIECYRCGVVFDRVYMLPRREALCPVKEDDFVRLMFREVIALHPGCPAVLALRDSLKPSMPTTPPFEPVEIRCLADHEKPVHSYSRRRFA